MTEYQKHQQEMRRGERTVRFILIIFGIGVVAGIALAHFFSK